MVQHDKSILRDEHRRDVICISASIIVARHIKNLPLMEAVSRNEVSPYGHNCVTE